jgi:hypothetical protein
MVKNVIPVPDAVVTPVYFFGLTRVETVHKLSACPFPIQIDGVRDVYSFQTVVQTP